MLYCFAVISLTVFAIVATGNDTIPPRKGHAVVVSHKRGQYRAAVFDQAPKLLKNASQILSRRQAVKFLSATLNVYEEQCRVGRLKEVSHGSHPAEGLSGGRDNNYYHCRPILCYIIIIYLFFKPSVTPANNNIDGDYVTVTLQRPTEATATTTSTATQQQQHY